MNPAHSAVAYCEPGRVQFRIERVGDFGPIGIIADRFAQEHRLRSAPECRFVQPDVAGQRMVCRDEPGDARLVAGLAKLGKEVAHAVRVLFMAESSLPCR